MTLLVVALPIGPLHELVLIVGTGAVVAHMSIPFLTSAPVGASKSLPLTTRPNVVGGHLQAVELVEQVLHSSSTQTTEATIIKAHCPPVAMIFNSVDRDLATVQCKMSAHVVLAIVIVGHIGVHRRWFINGNEDLHGVRHV